MDSSIPEYIEARIRRPSDGVPIVSRSTPVVSFGDLRNATVATLGLNPSSHEFCHKGKSRRERTGTSQRLETLTSLGVSDLSSAPSDIVQRVFDACNQYFEKQPFGNPYREWFDVLDGILRATLNASYYDGSACHLDLVQWATAEKWSKIDRDTQRTMIDADLPFLQRQLACEDIQVLFLNGTGVVARCRDLQLCNLAERPAIPVIADISLVLSVGQAVPNGAKVIGWNKNIQSEWDFQNYPHLRDLYVNSLIAAIHRELGPSQCKPVAGPGPAGNGDEPSA